MFRILAQAADQVAEATGQRPVVIGHSMGGLVVQKYLEQYSAPAGILLAAVPPHGVYRTTLRIFRLMPLKFLRNLSSG